MSYDVNQEHPRRSLEPCFLQLLTNGSIILCFLRLLSRAVLEVDQPITCLKHTTQLDPPIEAVRIAHLIASLVTTSEG